MRSLVFTLFLFLSLNGYAQLEKTEAKILASMQSNNVVGLSVAVIKGSDLVYNHSFGKKSIEENTDLKNNDIFRIASISKSFAATAIMQLVEAKKLSLDDDFGKLVGFDVRNPNYPETVITLRMVLSHTSSINDSEGYFNLDAINPSKNPNWVKCYTDKQPGTAFLYCNLNYNMVGAVIERYSGQRFDSYIRQHILKPLNLYGGHCVDSLDQNKFVSLYEYENKTFKLAGNAYAPRREELATYQLGYSTPILSPTGGVKISAGDLAKYMAMHLHYGKVNGVKIITKKSSKLMQTPVNQEAQYGLALSLSHKLVDGKQLVGHTGSAYGLYSAMFFDPKEQYGIVIITNGTGPNSKDGFKAIIKDAFNILYQDVVKN
jgi:CubicO group peptidase (beta-lactamase class C family)